VDPLNDVSLRDILIGETNAYIASIRNANIFYSLWNRNDLSVAVQYLNDSLCQNYSDDLSLFISVYDDCLKNTNLSASYIVILKSGLLKFVSTISSFTNIDEFYIDIQSKASIDALHEILFKHLTAEEQVIPYLFMPLNSFRDIAKKEGNLDFYITKIKEYIDPASSLLDDSVKEHLKQGLNQFLDSQKQTIEGFTMISRG